MKVKSLTAEPTESTGDELTCRLQATLQLPSDKAVTCKLLYAPPPLVASVTCKYQIPINQYKNNGQYLHITHRMILTHQTSYDDNSC